VDSFPARSAHPIATSHSQIRAGWSQPVEVSDKVPPQIYMMTDNLTRGVSIWHIFVHFSLKLLESAW
jgi:hypothetical protein